MMEIMEIMEIIEETNKNQRLDRFKKSKQLSLGELIKKIEVILSDDEEGKYNTVRYDFCRFFPTDLHSWRGAYCELSLNRERHGNPMKPIDFIAMLKEAIGKSFEGYKGGEFIMHEESPIWVSEQDYSGNTAVVDVIVDEVYQIILVTGYMEY